MNYLYCNVGMEIVLVNPLERTGKNEQNAVDDQMHRYYDRSEEIQIMEHRADLRSVVLSAIRRRG